jgi:hypothetical protein
MELIDELLQLLNAHPELPLYERSVLKMAISLLDQREHYFLEDDHNWRLRLTPEELDALPGGHWEYGNGQPCPK